MVPLTSGLVTTLAGNGPLRVYICTYIHPGYNRVVCSKSSLATAGSSMYDILSMTLSLSRIKIPCFDNSALRCISDT